MISPPAPNTHVQRGPQISIMLHYAYNNTAIMGVI